MKSSYVCSVFQFKRYKSADDAAKQTSVSTSTRPLVTPNVRSTTSTMFRRNTEPETPPGNFSDVVISRRKHQLVVQKLRARFKKNMLGRGTSIAAEKFYQIPTSNVPKACEKMNVNVVVEPKFSDTGF